MNPLILTTYFPKLSETFIYLTVAELANKGCNPHVLSLIPSEWPSMTKDIRARCVVADLGVPVEPQPFFRPYDLPWWARALLLIQREYRYDVHSIHNAIISILPAHDLLHVHYMSPPGTIAALLSGNINAPMILELHGYDIFRLARAEPNAASEVLSRFSRILVNSEYMAAMVKDILDTKVCGAYPKVSVIYNGIDMNIVDAVLREKRECGYNYDFVTAARLIEKKGIEDLIAAFAFVKTTQPSVTLAIVGSGPEMPILRMRAKSLGVSDSIYFLGEKSHIQTLREISRGKIFILPCKEALNGDMDSTPNVLLEAQALGIPVISTKVAGIPEIVENRKTGLLGDPGNRELLAKLMRSLLKDSEWQRELAFQARTYVRKLHKLDSRVKSIRCLYHEVCRERGQ